MKFDDPAQVEMVCYEMKLSDYARGQNRARINDLFNGSPPFTQQEVQENRIAINVNDLSSTRLGHDARAQFSSAFMKPGVYFRGKTDRGPKHRRQIDSTIVTTEIGKIMKRSIDYFECYRSKFAMNVLHGIGPSAHRDRDEWCPEAIGIEDVMIPSNTLLTMRNLPFFAIYRSFTGPELIKLTRGPNVDKAWNMPLVNACISWIDQKGMELMGTNWPEVWSPEKSAERVKQDGGFYVGDNVPTIDAWDFYYWSDESKNSGWRRRMILDSWSTPDAAQATGQAKYSPSRRTGGPYDEKYQWLYYPGSRKYADQRTELINFQFADLSSVAPFRYHSVRSLGFLIYALCHLQNRLRCKFNEAVFETLMMYFRVKTLDDFQRALKIDMITKGFIDETVQFVPPTERWQPNMQLAELGLQENDRLIQEHSSAYVQNTNLSQDRTHKTKFQVMAEVNAMTALVGAALQQAYQYQEFEYREIFRRFLRKNSTNIDVRRFRAAVLKQGVSEDLLIPEAWEITSERIMGGGNKTLEMTIAEQLLAMRPMMDPEPQREVLRDSILAITDDADRAERLVPEGPTISSSVHDAQLAAGTLMQGLKVDPKDGINELEYIPTLLAQMGMICQQGQQQGNMVSPEKLAGLQNMAQHISQHIQLLAQDPEQKPKVKEFSDVLGRLMNLVKGFAQRLQEMMKKQQQQNGEGVTQEDRQKLEFEKQKDAMKLKQQAESHAQRTAQRQVQFEREQQMEDRRHGHEQRRQSVEHAHEQAREDFAHRQKLKNDELETQSNIERNRLSSMDKDQE